MPPESLGGRIILGLLICTSAALFAWRMRGVVRVVSGAKEDGDFSVFPAGPRVWRFVTEVLLQSKVIVQRPLGIDGKKLHFHSKI